MSSGAAELKINMAISDELGLIGVLAEKIGAPEAGIRLLLSIFAGYPIAIIYRCCILQQTTQALHHIYFALCGLLLCIFNYGFDTYHSLIAISITYTFVRLLHKTPRQLLIVNFIFHMSYLLVGYYYTESNEYDILWTMPHCVLVLRLIGFGFDVADGRKPRDQLSKEQQDTALEELPSLLELSAYAYFPCAFLIGPQFPLRRYKRYINGEFRQHQGAVQAGVQRLLLGMLYLTMRQVGSTLLPDSYLLTDTFRNKSLLLRLLQLGLWGRLSLYKYISCWLLTEGALMSLGFSYGGQKDNGEADWSGCSNVKLYLLETGYSMQHYVQSFNVNTNHWVAQYIYKRLKFLNNRTISYASALIFLAIWHGFHSGYYMAFLIEYMIVTVEKQIDSAYTKHIETPYAHVLGTSSIYKALKYLLLKTYDLIYMGWCLTPFIFLNYERWIKVFSAVHYFGFVFVGSWICINQLLRHIVSTQERAREDQTFGRATTLSPTVESKGKAD